MNDQYSKRAQRCQMNLTIVVLLLSLCLASLVAYILEQSRVASRRQEVMNTAVVFSDRISDRLTHSLSASYGLAAVVRQGNGRIDHFETLASEMLKYYQGVNSLQLSPGGIVSYIYPLAGNEKAIGHNLLEDTQRNKEAILALKTHTLTLAGPFELVQGGMGVVGRLPVFLKDGNGNDYFWGFTSVLIKIDQLLQSVNENKLLEQGYRYQISRIHPDSGKQQIIAGVANLKDPVRYSIQVPNGTWTVAMEPVSGWYIRNNIALETALVLVFSLLSTAIVYVLARQPAILQRLVDQKTSQLTEVNSQLLASEKKFLAAFDHAPLLMSLSDPKDHRYREVNLRFCEVTGYNRQQVIGKSWLELGLVSQESDQRVSGRLAEQGAIDGLDLEMTATDGRIIYCYFRGEIIDIGGSQVLLSIALDVTNQRNAEKALRQSEELRRLVLDSTCDGIYGVDTNGSCIFANQACIKMLGYEHQEDLLGRNMHDLIHHSYADGTPAPAEYCRIYKAYLEGNGTTATDEVFWRRDGSQFPVEYSSHPIWKDGTITGAVVSWRDVTERRQAEEERLKLERQLLHTQKLESLGVLAGGIAHDFNNILMAIVGNTDLAMSKIDPDSRAATNLRQIRQASSRAADLAKQMLAYSGKGRFVIESIDINHLLEEMLHMLEVSISKKVELRLSLGNLLPLVRVDATQIRQVIMNLVINASEAIGEDSGTITITTGSMRCDQKYLTEVWLDESLPAGNYLFLEVSDTGCGMERDVVSKIFDPFFTTKFTGRGLGMAAVMGIIRGHNGAIRIYSEPGQGSVFKILLPASEATVISSAASSASPDSWRGSGSVLLVDDEEVLREIGSEMLTELGFEVATASDGQEALEIFNTKQFDLVILDLTMPRLDGEQTFREMRRLKPETKVIMSSGYNEQEVSQRLVDHGLAGFIQKPYTFDMLAEAVRKGLR